jgi:hypothetical protein
MEGKVAKNTMMLGVVKVHSVRLGAMKIMTVGIAVQFTFHQWKQKRK